jgi:ectoine hydroxylase-related dioxygenase (phytanoyl-CoA dioxygenase family)
MLVRQQAGRLSAQQRESLERDGYLLVSSLLDETILVRIASRLEELVRQTVAAWAADPGRAVAEVEGGGVVRAKVELADRDFALCCEHPLVAEAATAVLGHDWFLAGLGVRVPLPGSGHQGLHADFEQRRTDGPWQTLSAMWCIAAFTPDNGPLRVIPGSHRVSEPPIDMENVGVGDGAAPG